MSGRGLGRVLATRGHLVEVELPGARVGGGVRIDRHGGALGARIVAVTASRAVLAPFGGLHGIALGDSVASDPAVLAVPLGTALLGRAVDAVARPLDGGPAPHGARRIDLDAPAAPGARRPNDSVFWTGVRAIDGPLAIGRGARIGLFGAPGAGKSTLLEALVRGATADAVVVGLIGERGREAERWLAALDARTTIVCATGDRAPAERVRAAELAFAQACALRARGLNVLLVVDSLARIAAAAREIALGAGEPAGRGGFPPSVFSGMTRLLERAGAFSSGSVTVIATVLSDGPGDHDPVSEAARAALDGHLVLSERLAREGRFPAIDLPRSASRTFTECAGPAHVLAARVVRAAVAALDDSRDARALGLDPAAGDPFLARSVARESALEHFLRQDGTPSTAAYTLTELLALAHQLQSEPPR